MTFNMPKTLAIIHLAIIAAVILEMSLVSSKAILMAKSQLPQSVNWRIEVLKTGTVKPPVDITNLKVAGKTVSFGDSNTIDILESDDFLRNATVGVTNSSSKTINTISIQILYYAPGRKNPSASMDCWIGSMAHYPGVKPTMWLASAQTTEIAIPAAPYQRFLDAIKASNSSAGTIKVRAVDVVFDGQPDVMWRNGQWMQRDSNDPYHFQRIGKNSAGYQKINFNKPRSLSSQVCLVDAGFWFRNCNNEGPCAFVESELDYDPNAGDLQFNLEWGFCVNYQRPTEICFQFDYYYGDASCP